MPASDQPSFANMYATGFTPWDTGKPCPQLLEALKTGALSGHTVLEMGCGVGTNAIELARRGFKVTAVDYVPQAVDTSKTRAEKAGLLGDNLKIMLADLTEKPKLGGPFDILFDRGVYHSIRTVNLPGFLETLQTATKSGTRWLCMAGNSKEKHENGPPTVSEQEFRSELGGLFNILSAQETVFDTNRPGFSPSAWVILMERK